jgi:glycylpeptide N-tetradecanoyltransferase
MSSKPDDPSSTHQAADEVIAESKSANVESENEDEHDPDPVGSGAQAQTKKKKSKKKRIKAALGVGGDGAEDKAAKGKEDIQKALAGLSKGQVQELLELNPGLAAQLREKGGGSDLSGASMADQLKRLKACGLFVWFQRLLLHSWTRPTAQMQNLSKRMNHC